MQNLKLKLKIQNLLVIGHLALIIHLSFSIGHLAFAQESTPSATPTIVSDEEKTQQFIEAVREKVKSKQTEASRRAFIGTLKNIADTTLILETKDGIKQAAVSTEAAIVRDTGDTKKTIKFTDLAIGDFTIAMGYLGEKEVLEASRVIVNAAVKARPERRAIYAEVQEIDTKKRTLSVKTIKENQIWLLTIDKKAVITGTEDLTTIQPGDRLIAIGTTEEEAFTITRLHLLAAPISPAPAEE